MGRTFPNRTTLILVTLLMACGMAGLVWRFLPTEGRTAVTERETATRMLAEHLAQHHKSGSILVISNPFSEMPGRPANVYVYQQAAVAGLRKGFGTGAKCKIVFPKLRPEALRDQASVFVDPKSTTPLSFLIAENAFDDLIQANPDCELVVSLIGLPVNLSKVRAWAKAGSPKFALLLPDWRMIGNLDAVREALKTRKIEAAVVSRPGNLTGDSEDSRFLLVTPENVDALTKLYPQCFPK